MYKAASKSSVLTRPYLLGWPLLVGLALTCLSHPTQAKLESEVNYQQSSYKLCAKQRVTKALFFDVVDVGIYYLDCETAKDAFDSQPKLLRFSYLRKVEGSQFTEGADDFLEDNLSDTEKDNCLERFQDFNAIYKDVSDGDYYDLFVTPDKSLNLFLNESHLAELNSVNCAVPYLNIWFGPKSMDDDFSDLNKKINSLN